MFGAQLQAKKLVTALPLHQAMQEPRCVTDLGDHEEAAPGGSHGLVASLHAGKAMETKTCACWKIIVLHTCLGSKDQSGLHCKISLSLLVIRPYPWVLIRASSLKCPGLVFLGNK